MFHRALGQVTFSVLSMAAALYAGKHDVLFASSPPFTIGFAAWLLSKCLRIPMVFDVRDPYPTSAIHLGILRDDSVLASILSRLERAIYHKSVLVITVTKGFQKLLHENGCSQDKSRLVPNGVNTRDFRRPESPSRPDLAVAYGLDSRFAVVYTGTLGRVHRFDLMVEAAKQLRGDPQIQFLFIGDGIKKSQLLRAKSDFSLHNLHIFDAVDSDTVREILAYAAVGFEGFEDIPYIERAHAVKVFEYMAMELPVLFAGKGETAELIQDAHAGIVCPYDDLRAFLNAIVTLRDNPQLRKQLGQNGRRFVCESFDREDLSDRLVRNIESVFLPRPSHGR